jgi:molybdate transport system permease protein
MMTTLTFQSFFTPVLLSLKISLIASVLVLLLGTLAAWWMSHRRFFGITLLETLFMLPLVLPPTVVGFLLLVLLGRRSWLGRMAEWWFHEPIIFSWWAGVIAAVVVSFPLVYQTMKAGFSSQNADIADAARSSGASEWQVLRFITLPLASRSIITAYILGFARGLGEFGATLMIAGNIPGETQTLPTAIYTAVESGRMAQAWWWTATVIALSFVMMYMARARKIQDY